MSTLSVRLPESLHKKIKKLAKEEKVSINQFISGAAAEKISVIMTVEYLKKEAKLGKITFVRIFAARFSKIYAVP